MKVSYKQISPAFQKAFIAEKRIDRELDIDWQLKDFMYLHNCRVHTTLDAGGEPCLDYVEFSTPEEATMFMLRWA